MSKKRFTETTKWTDKWFMDLTPIHKLLWLYLLDNCDNCGVFDPNMKLIEFVLGDDLGFTLDDNGFIEDKKELENIFNDRIRVMKGGKWFIPNYILFQVGKELNPNCKPHYNIINLLEKHGLKDFAKGYLTLKDKEKAKNKDIDKKKYTDKKKD